LPTIVVGGMGNVARSIATHHTITVGGITVIITATRNRETESPATTTKPTPNGSVAFALMEKSDDPKPHWL
jgi:hypothetical protein